MLTDRDYQELLEAIEGELDEASARRLEMRLQASEELRLEYDRIRSGRSLMERLEVSPMPGERAQRVRNHVRAGLPAAQARSSGTASASMIGQHQRLASSSGLAAAWLAAAALIVVAVATGLFLQLRQPSVQLRLAQDPASMLERAAYTIHTGKHSPGPVVNLASASLSDAQQWISRTAGLELETDIPATPKNCCQDVSLRQACKTSVEGCTTMALRYEVAGHPVTLLIADAARLKDAPEPSLWHKNVVYRPAEGDGLKTLSWTDGGQTYTLISDLPGYGQQACYLCHLDESTRHKIENLELSF
ncbi:MAG TPA: hypothetical protein VLV83_25500 [Acidobacteriota bacterium]|nr:hypothetical protein [Acidobacteriota bacterium]